MTTNYKNLINGEWKPAKSGNYFENRNPADWNEDLIGSFPLSEKEDVSSVSASITLGKLINGGTGFSTIHPNNNFVDTLYE